MIISDTYWFAEMQMTGFNMAMVYALASSANDEARATHVDLSLGWHGQIHLSLGNGTLEPIAVKRVLSLYFSGNCYYFYTLVYVIDLCACQPQSCT